MNHPRYPLPFDLELALPTSERFQNRLDFRTFASGYGVPAYYFPVEAAPLRMRASLARFGTDFGLGEADARYFQRDGKHAAYRQAKQRVSEGGFVLDEGADAASGVFAWMRETMTREGLDAPHGEGTLDQQRCALAEALQEDFAILIEGEGSGRTIALDVRLPSGWQPERLKNADFDEIHGPVPGFPADDAAPRGMIKAMIERGPYVRFVWTLSPSDVLDQHPERYDRRAAWSAPDVHFRVERQVSVPFPDLRASLFLIRVYQTPWGALAASDRARLRQALACMPEEVRAYKGLDALEPGLLL